MPKAKKRPFKPNPTEILGFLGEREYYSGILHTNTQRILWGKYLGYGQIFIDKESRIVAHFIGKEMTEAFHW